MSNPEASQGKEGALIAVIADEAGGIFVSTTLDPPAGAGAAEG